ncbi:MAG: hypothetical protein GX897_09360 [Clostridiales bacterium]|nr:hypothetical protein [Clostridiales bacterium]
MSLDSDLQAERVVLLTKEDENYMNLLENIIKEISTAFENQEKENKDKEEIKKKYNGDEGKNGIYLLYNQKEVIYVGIVGEGKCTSFYHRMYAHGNGAHKREDWFDEIKYFKYIRFPQFNKKELEAIEWLMIFYYEKPKYNNTGISKKECEEILNKLQTNQT